jgi:hypothetical protein
VLFSANDAYMRDYSLQVPGNCIASETPARNRMAISYLRHVVKADVSPWKS